jgi:hypothetical protein
MNATINRKAKWCNNDAFIVLKIITIFTEAEGAETSQNGKR